MEKATVGSDGTVPATAVAPENEEATEAWSGVLFDRFVEFRELIVDSLKLHGDAAMRLHPPKPGIGSSTSAAASATRPSSWPR